MMIRGDLHKAHNPGIKARLPEVLAHEHNYGQCNCDICHWGESTWYGTNGTSDDEAVHLTEMNNELLAVVVDIARSMSSHYPYSVKVW